MLNPKHKSHNIPGKFISYLHYGLPVVASVNKGNDLFNIISKNKVGFVSNSSSSSQLIKIVSKAMKLKHDYIQYKKNCIELSKKQFSTRQLANKIIKKLI